MGKSIIAEKSYAFAIRVVRMYQHLSAEKKEFVLSKQVLRSGTSLGANVEEATGGQPTADFIHKLNKARKEAREKRLTGSGFYMKRETSKRSTSIVYKQTVWS